MHLLYIIYQVRKHALQNSSLEINSLVNFIDFVKFD